MLLKRYGNLDYILNLDFKDGEEYINYIYEQEIEEKLFFRWVMRYEDKITYEEFKEKMKEQSYQSNDNRTQAEILEKVRKILDKGGAVSGDI